MSREIKFRAWDGVKMRGVDKNDYFSIRNDGVPSQNVDVVLMQFTGLKDNTGKDIYEGDIVTCKMAFDDNSLPHRGEIIYMDEFGAFATKNDAGKTLLHNHLLNTFEVVGNVFES